MAPIFDYKAIDAAGKQSRGIIEADTSRTARQKLKKQGVMVIDIAEKTVASVQQSAGTVLFAKKVGVNDLALATRQLASLVKANIPLVEALNALVDQTENERLKVVLNEVKRAVNEGSSLAKALKAHSGVFDNVFINMIEAGESSGTLGPVLLRLADLKEAQMRLRRKIVSGMTYPVLMMVVAVVLLVVIFAFVIPKLTQVFESMNKPVPLETQILIVISSFMTSYWYLLFAGMIFIYFSFFKYINSKEGRLKWDRFRLKAPLLGPINRMIVVTRFSGTMGTLLGSGVPILTAMTIAKNLVGNEIIAKAIEEARENITEGQSIAEPLRKSKEFPPLVTHMISIGEKTGELPDMLRNVAESFEEQVNAKIDGLTALLEPIMIIGMGGVVGFIVFAIFIPLLEISNLN